MRRQVREPVTEGCSRLYGAIEALAHMDYLRRAATAETCSMRQATLKMPKQKYFVVADKVMIQQQVHLQLPCYDFCPVQATAITFVLWPEACPEGHATSDPEYSRNGSVLGSDGRCVQRAGT